jgi:hypothetical protein
MIKDYRELPPVTKNEARTQQEDAMARFLAQGGMVE